MSLSGEDSNGNKLNAELEEELQELRTEKKILDAIKPLADGITEIKLQLKGIDDKVMVHNNYEKRIRSLEIKIWGITSIYTGLLAIMGVIYFIIK